PHSVYCASIDDLCRMQATEGMSTLRNSLVLHTVMVMLCIITSQQQQCGSSSQRCLATHCLSCANAPANCSVNPISQTVSCTGETSTCRTLECDSCSHCVAYYYQRTYNFTTTHHFTSGCVSNELIYSCPSLQCVGGGPVESENNLLELNYIFCSCYANNCTANLSFHYTIVASRSTWTVSSSSSFAMKTTFLASPAAGSGLELYNVAIVVLSCLLFISFMFALAIIGITIK
ncbi:hypothetical protein EMCRGX_G004697, partial [Ephydatia muelleri]